MELKSRPDLLQDRNADLLIIADNFDMRAKNLLANYNFTHLGKEKKSERWKRTQGSYDAWKNAATVLREIAKGNIKMEQLMVRK